MTPTPEERAGGIKPYWHNDQRTWEDVLVDVAIAIHDAERVAFERGAIAMKAAMVCEFDDVVPNGTAFNAYQIVAMLRALPLPEYQP